MSDDVELKDLVEALSQTVVLADPSDLRELADLHAEIVGVYGRAVDESSEQIVSTTKDAADLLEKIILGDVDDAEASFDTVAEMIAAIQEYVRTEEVGNSAECSSELSFTGEENPSIGNADAHYVMPAAVDAAIVSDFLSRQGGVLDEFEALVLSADTTDNRVNIDALGRLIHTMKGDSGLLGMIDVEQVCHGLEGLLTDHGLVELADEFLRAKDWLGESFKWCAGQGARPEPFEVSVKPFVVENSGALSRNSDETEEVTAPTMAEEMDGPWEAEADDSAMTLESMSDERLDLEEVQPPSNPSQKKFSTEKIKEVRVRETINIDAERLHQLVDTIGELVIAESMVVQHCERGGAGSAELSLRLNQLDKITRDLQEMGTSLRMVSIRPLFNKMARLVRDLAQKSGKEIIFEMSGEDTELDKSLVDCISDPLVHMMRNAADHGLEADAAERKKAGKSPDGRIHLRAYHKGGNVCIDIEDDGRGLDRERILEKAIDRGIIQDGSALSDPEVWNLIFEPGLSTAEKVSGVSGRGVGMDVVRRNIKSLRGQINIQSTQGEGSLFSIRLPLTLAIIDGMIIKVGSERFIFPTLSIIISLRPEPDAISTITGKKQLLQHRGEFVPIFHLGQNFGLSGAELDVTKALVIVVEVDGNKVGLVADELLGQQQIVIKTLGDYLGQTPGVAGGTIMADGKVGLILDLNEVLQLSKESNSRVANLAHIVKTDSADKLLGSLKPEGEVVELCEQEVAS